MIEIIQKIKNLIVEANKIVIVIPKKWKSSEIGSQQGLGLIIKKKYPEKEVYTSFDGDNSIVKKIKFLNPINSSFKTQKNGNDLFIYIGGFSETFLSKLINEKIVLITDNKQINSINKILIWKNDGYSSIGEMCGWLINEAYEFIDEYAANFIYYAITGGSDSFQSLDTSSKTFQLAAIINKKYKIKITEIRESLLNISLIEMQIKGYVQFGIKTKNKIAYFDNASANDKYHWKKLAFKMENKVLEKVLKNESKFALKIAGVEATFFWNGIQATENILFIATSEKNLKVLQLDKYPGKIMENFVIIKVSKNQLDNIWTRLVELIK